MDNLVGSLRIIKTLNRVMEKQNKNCSVVARQTGLSIPGVWNIMNGHKSPTLDNLIKITNALHLDIVLVEKTEKRGK